MITFHYGSVWFESYLVLGSLGDLARPLHPLAATLVNHQCAPPALDPRGRLPRPLDWLHPLPPVHVSPERQGGLPRSPRGGPIQINGGSATSSVVPFDFFASEKF